MSRSEYDDDFGSDNQWDLIRYRGAVKSAFRGRRGQQFLQELATAMDAMPEKKLIAEELEVNGQFCTLGVIGHARGLDMTNIDPANTGRVSSCLGIAEAMAREIVWLNDECSRYAKYDETLKRWVDETPEERWARMRALVQSQIDNPGRTL